jgi:hypothetical protein
MGGVAVAVMVEWWWRWSKRQWLRQRWKHWYQRRCRGEQFGGVGNGSKVTVVLMEALVVAALWWQRWWQWQ